MRKRKEVLPKVFPKNQMRKIKKLHIMLQRRVPCSENSGPSVVGIPNVRWSHENRR